MNAHDKKYRMIADPTASAMVIVFVIVLCLVCLDIIIGAVTFYNSTGDDSGLVTVIVVFSLFLMTTIITSYFLAKQMCVRIIFDKDTITIHPLFKKPFQRAYKYYPYVYKGGYWHGSPIGVGKWVDYIVLSHGYIKNDDLMRINALGKDNEVIRIRYRRKNYDRLLAALPTEMAHKVKACFPES